MKIVLDSNVFKDFFIEVVKEQDSILTDSSIEIFNRLGVEDVIFFDSGGQIKSEWRSVVADEWFDVWYRTQLLLGGISLIDVELCRDIKNNLQKLGFPRSRDIWYIRVAKSVINRYNAQGIDNNESFVCLISEDLDFFDPPNKNRFRGARRLKALRDSNGNVARYLRRRERIFVNCVENYLRDYCE